MSNADTVSTDVLIIGGGPSGLATSIHLADILKKKPEQQEYYLLKKVVQSAVIYYQVLLLNHLFLKNYCLMWIFQKSLSMPR